MQKCPVCSYVNRVGEVFCTKCGSNLRTGTPPLSTKTLGEEASEEYQDVLEVETIDEDSTSGRGTDVFPKGGSLRLEIEGSPEPIHLSMSHREIVLGRRDPATGALPDVDMTPFAGYRMGVSRRHSQIRYADDDHLDVFDLGSSNGTFLNGQRLEAHYPYRLHDGDRVGLGQIVIRMFFQPIAEVAKQPVPPFVEATDESKPTTTVSEEKPSNTDMDEEETVRRAAPNKSQIEAAQAKAQAATVTESEVQEKAEKPKIVEPTSKPALTQQEKETKIEAEASQMAESAEAVTKSTAPLVAKTTESGTDTKLAEAQAKPPSPFVTEDNISEAEPPEKDS